MIAKDFITNIDLTNHSYFMILVGIMIIVAIITIMFIAKQTLGLSKKDTAILTTVSIAIPLIGTIIDLLKILN